MKPFEVRMMQGRLLPRVAGQYQAFPEKEWMLELEKASEIGLSGIEWILDEKTLLQNPLSSVQGREQLASVQKSLNLRIDSVCADIFMTKLLIDESGQVQTDSIKTLQEVLLWCGELNMRYVVLPFVDSSRLGSEDQVDGVRQLLKNASSWASSFGVEIHLESDLQPHLLRKIVDDTESPWIKLNYDIGNSASLGYRHEDEFAIYGHLIGSVHIKDRVKGGTTVPLGEGDANVVGVLRNLFAEDYKGDLVMQIARGIDGHEFDWIKHNFNLVRELVEVAEATVDSH